MNNEKSTLEQHLSSVATQKEGIEKIVFDKEIQISKKLEYVEKVLQQFNTIVRKLQMIPSNSKFAKGVNYQLSLNSHNPELILDHLRGTVKPSLDQLRTELLKAFDAAKEALLTLQEKLDRLEEAITDKKEELTNVENKTKKLEGSYRKEKERTSELLKQNRTKLESLVQETLQVKESTGSLLSQSNESLEGLSQEHDTLSQKCNLELEEMNNVVIKTLDSLGAHRSYLQENLAGLHQYYTQVLAQVQKM